MAQNITPALYNSKTRQAESVPVDQLEDAIVSGTHSYAAATDVNVVGPDGRAQSVKAEDLQRAIGEGYKIERPDEYAVRKYTEENAGTSGAVKSFGRSLINEGGMGIPEVLEEKFQDPLEVAKARALSKQHAIASGIGSVSGFAASLAYGGPLFKAAAKTGKVVAAPIARQVAAGLAKVGMKSGASGAAANIVTKATEKAIELGVEGAVVSAPKAITEATLGDPEQAAETLLIGGGIGLALGLPGGLAGQTYREVNKAAGRVLAAREASALARAGKEVPTSLAERASGEVESTGGEVLKSVIGQKKVNSSVIEAAAAEEGVPLFVGMTEGSKFVQDAASNLSQRPTGAGALFQQEVQKTFDGLQSSAERLVGKVDDFERAEISRAKAGQSTKDEMMRDLGARLDDVEGRFGNIRERTGEMPASPEVRDQVVGEIRKSDVFKLDTLKSIRGEAEAVISDLGKAGNVNDVARLYTIADQKLRAAMRAGEGETIQFWRKTKDAIRKVEEASVVEGTSAMGLKGAEGKAAAEALTAERGDARKIYSELKTFLKEINENFKIGRGASQRDLVEKIAAIDPGDLTKKLFQPGKIKTLSFFADKFPSAFESVKQVYLQDLKQAVTRDAKMNLGSLVRRLDNLEPEAQLLIFGEKGVKSIANLKTLVEALPSSANPSKTSYAQAFGRLFTPQGVMDNVNDALTYAALKNKDRVAGILRTEKAMAKVAEKFDTIPEVLDSSAKQLGSGAIFQVRKDQAALAALIRLFDDHDEKPKNKQEAFQKASEKIQDAVSDPEKAAEPTGVFVNAVKETGAPNIGDAFGMKTSMALQYLNAELPRPYAPNGLLNKDAFKPSSAQIAQFERKLGVVMDPLSVIDDLKSGTITADHMQALQTVYPKLYQQMQRRVFDWASTRQKTVPYKMRLRLSLFMGMPMDSTTQPDSIFALQQSFLGPDEQEQADQEFRGNLSVADNTAPETSDRNGSA